MATKKTKATLEDTLKASADGTAPQVSATIISASKKFANGIDRETIEKLIAEGVLDRVDLYLPWDEFNNLLERELGEHLIKGIRDGANLAQADTQRAAKKALGFEPVLTFDATNPRVERWIDKNTARLVTLVTDETKAAIKDAVRDAMREERAPIEVFRRIKAVIGLNQRQGKALENYRSGLIKAGAAKSRVTELVNTYREQQLKYRANMIAGTEMMAAINQGHIEGQRQAVDEGFVKGKAMKQWITAPEDGILCPSCRAMNGKKVPLDAPFNVTLYRETSKGLKVVGNVKVDTPPVHPHCRCTHLLVVE
jgi:hypothetical protein